MPPKKKRLQLTDAQVRAFSADFGKATDDELLALVRELSRRAFAAPDDEKGDALDLAQRASGEVANRANGAKAAKAKAATAKANAARGRKYEPTEEDRFKILLQAYQASLIPDDRYQTLYLRMRTRIAQAAIRDLHGENLMRNVGVGRKSKTWSRESEQYSQRSYIISDEGKARLAEMLADRGQSLDDFKLSKEWEPGGRSWLNWRRSVHAASGLSHDDAEERAKIEARQAGGNPRDDTAERAEAERKRVADRAALVAEYEARRSRSDAAPKDAPSKPPGGGSTRLAQARYAEVKTASQTVLQTVQGLWRDADPLRILSAMQGEIGKQILAAVMGGQLSVAQGAQAYVSSAMMSQGVGFSPLARLNPGALAGVAADGRSLATLLQLPSITTSRALAAGMSGPNAMALGLNQMATLVATTLADTNRAATSVAMAAEPRCISYVRVVKLPACSRCIILAGRQYSYSTGFKRHPKCDCGMEPMSDSEWKSSDSPTSLLASMSPEERRIRFGVAGSDALANGADIGQVVNARRGMSTATVNGRSVQVTNEGTTKRGIGGKALAAGFQKTPGSSYARSRAVRLMPEEILRLSSDREHQIRLLKKNGYIV